MNAKVIFEPPYKKHDIIQCKRCQRYGHSKSYCRYPYRCVKCGLDHETASCTKDKSTPAKCALCDGVHAASYKGCQVYKSLKNKTFPPLKNRTFNSTVTNDRQPQESQPNTTRTSATQDDSKPA